MSILKKLLYILHSTFCILFVAAPALAASDFGLGEAAAKAGLKPATDIGPPAFIGSLIGYALTFIGVVFFILMVYGGFLWMTAHGNEENVKKAKNLIEAAVIGIVIVFLAYTVTNFVLGRLLAGAGIVPEATP